MFQVLILNARPESSKPILFEGSSQSVILPGAEGDFEILDFHKPIISRLKKGVISVDNEKEIQVKGGVATMQKQKLLAIVDV